MALTVREIAKEESQTLDSFVVSSASPHAKQMSSWSIVGDVHPGAKVRCLALEDNGHLAATAVVHFHPIVPGFYLALCEGGPVVGDRTALNVWGDAADALARYARRHRAVMIRVWPYLPYEGNEGIPEALRSRGYVAHGHGLPYRATRWIDLSATPDELLANMYRSTRQGVRICMRKDVQVAQGTEESLLDLFWGVFAETCEIKGLRPPPREELVAILRAGAGSVHVALHEDQPAHVLFLILQPSHHSSILLYAGTARDLKNVPAGPFIHWHAMQWVRERGFRIYDLGGIGLDVSSEAVARIDAFKRRLGGYDIKLVNMHERVLLMPGLVRAARTTISRIRSARTKPRATTDVSGSEADRDQG